MGIWGQKKGEFGAENGDIGAIWGPKKEFGHFGAKSGNFGSPQPQLITFRAEIRPFWGLREGK